MNNKKRFGIELLLVSFFLCSCVKQIEVKLNDYNIALVVNSLITPDSLVTVFVGTTVPILNSEPSYLNNATVLLWENDLFVDTLNNAANGVYKSSIIPKVGGIYKIEVAASNFNTVYAVDTVPEKIIVKDGYYSIIPAINNFNDSYYDYFIEFEDNRQTENFYDVAFIGINYDSFTDSTRINYNFFVAVADPIISSEGDLDYEPITFIFSDELINGQNYILHMRLVPIANSISYAGKLKGLENGEYVLLKSISKNYFEYRKSWIRHYFTQANGQYVSSLSDLIIDDITGLLFAQDPISMTSNIENGYGVFAAYNSSFKNLRLVE